MTSTNEGRTTWNRKRATRRQEDRRKRTLRHVQGLRRQGQASGPKGLAEAEWNIIRAAIGRLSAELQDAEWKSISGVLRQLNDGLSSRHKQ